MQWVVVPDLVARKLFASIRHDNSSASVRAVLFPQIVWRSDQARHVVRACSTASSKPQRISSKRTDGALVRLMVACSKHSSLVNNLPPAGGADDLLHHRQVAPAVSQKHHGAEASLSEGVLDFEAELLSDGLGTPVQ